MKDKLVEKVSRQIARRAERCLRRLIVYTYRSKADGELSDNFVCLPLAERDAHVAYLERMYSAAIDEGNGCWLKNFDLVKIGIFDKAALSFRKSQLKVVVDFAELIARLDLIKEKKNEK